VKSHLRMAADGTRKSTSGARSGPTKPMPRPLIPMPCSTARDRAWRPSSVSSVENRNGLFVAARLTKVSGHAERLAALDMIEAYANRPGAITLAADKGFDAANFVMELREINVTPHIAQNTTRRSAVDRRTTRHSGYEFSQCARKRIEEGFGWMKTIGGIRRMKYRGRETVASIFTLAAAAYNLIRIPKLMEAT